MPYQQPSSIGSGYDHQQLQTTEAVDREATQRTERPTTDNM
jgi:hypothetical protein